MYQYILYTCSSTLNEGTYEKDTLVSVRYIVGSFRSRANRFYSHFPHFARVFLSDHIRTHVHPSAKPCELWPRDEEPRERDKKMRMSNFNLLKMPCLVPKTEIIRRQEKSSSIAQNESHSCKVDRLAAVDFRTVKNLRIWSLERMSKASSES